jgi:hypothetical protein
VYVQSRPVYIRYPWVNLEETEGSNNRRNRGMSCPGGSGEGVDTTLMSCILNCINFAQGARRMYSVFDVAWTSARTFCMFYYESINFLLFINKARRTCDLRSLL